MRFTSLATLAAMVLLSASPLMAEERRPNIVVVLTDDMGIGDVASYGGTLAPTPSLDRLAREGTQLQHYYSASPICSPSRTGLLTGMYPARWRITSYLQTRAGNKGCEQVDFLDPGAPSLARSLKASGYATAHFGKWHMGGGRDVVDPPRFAAYGFDEHASTWESPEPHPDLTASNWIWSPQDKIKRWERTGYFVDRTLDFLAKHPNQPCYVNLWPDDIHTPWVPDEAAQNEPAPARANAKKKAAAKKKATAAAPANTPERHRKVMIEYDRQMGRLLDGLKSRGLEDNTLVIFTSDNGALPTFQGARSGGLRASKLSLYEGGIRMPFIVKWPRHVPAGRVDDSSVVAAVDLFPTLCKIAGAKLPEGAALDGEDRSGILLGAGNTPRQKPLYWEYGRNDQFFAYPPGRDRSPNVAVRDGRWKLLVNADGTRAELYDVVADRAEAHDMAASQTAEAKRLTEMALAWRKSLPKLDQGQ